MNIDYTAKELERIVSEVLESADENGVLPIVQLGHPVLRQRAIQYAAQLPARMLEDLLDAMRLAMYDAPGVGLAAPQVGIPLQIAVIEDLYPIPDSIAVEREREPLEYFEIFNPTYVASSTRQAEFFEGCLSFDGFQGVVTRPADISATFEDRSGEQHTKSFSGWQARIVQHETDHLYGTVYVDKVQTRSLINERELWRHDSLDLPTARRVLNF